jgi:hypothetical protein
MPVDIVEMLWKCPACRSTVLGRYKACYNCGQFRTPDVEEWLPDDISHEAAVRDAELLNKFEGGEDRHCEYCGSSQWKVDDSCQRCGSPAHSEKVIQEIEEASKLPISAAEQDVLGGRNHSEFERRVTKQSQDWPPKPVVKKRASQLMYEEDMGWHPPSKVLWGIVGGVAGAIAFISLVLYLIFHTVTHYSVVTATRWTDTVEVQRYQINHHDGWSPPLDALNVNNEGERIHHYNHVLDHYDTVSYMYQEACGQTCTQIPRTCSKTSRSCTSNKNGSATCTGGDTVCTGGGQSCSTKYCTRTGTRREARYRNDPVYQAYYSWRVWEWTFNRNVVAAGNDTAPHSPTSDQLALNANVHDSEKERTAGESLELNVVFTDDDDHENHDYTPHDVSEFKSLPVGTHKVIEVGTMGGVAIAREK